MNGDRFGRFAAGHRAGSDFVPAVSLVVVAIHRRFFAFYEGMMMGRDGAMVAGATYAAGYGQSRNNRTLKQQGREEANERRHAAARERITEMAGELHSATSVLSIIRQKPAAGPPERAFLQNAPAAAAARNEKIRFERLGPGDSVRIARGVRRDCIGAHAIMRSYLPARVGAKRQKGVSVPGPNACERAPARDSR